MGRHHNSLALCALIVLLAGGVWWISLASSRAVEEGADPPAPVAQPLHAAVRLEAPVRAAQPLPTRSRNDASEEMESDEEAEELARAALRAAGELPAPTLQGRVMGPLGQPIAGARVLLPRETAIAGAALDAWVNRSAVREVLTDAQGSFGPLAARPGVQWIAVRAAGHAPWEAELEPLALGEIRDLGELRLPRSDVISGKLVDVHGEAVVAAAIFRADAASGAPRWRQGASVLPPLWMTGEDGRFELASLPPGGATVLVRHAEHPDAEFEASRRDGQGELVWTLGPGARIAGTVPGLRPEQAQVLVVVAIPYLTRQDSTRGPRERASLIGVRGLRSAPVTEEGKFEVRGLVPEAPYRLKVFESARLEAQIDGTDAWSEWLLARAGDEHVTLAYGPSARIEFTVVDASTGQPIEAMRITVDGAECLDAAGKPRRKFGGGRVEIPGLRLRDPREGIATSQDGTLQVSVDAIAFELRTIEDIAIEPGEIVSLGELRLLPLPTFHVRVEDSTTHAPLGGAQVTLLLPDGTPRDTRSVSRAIARRDGRARLTSVGFPAIVRARHEGYLGLELVIPALPPPDEPWIVPMSKAGTLIATVREALGRPVAAARVHLEEVGVSEINALKRTLDSDVAGRATFTGLHTGIYAVFARRPDGIGGLVGPVELEISSPSTRVVEGDTSELEVTVTPLSSLTLRLRAGSEPVDHAVVSFVPVPPNTFYSNDVPRHSARGFRADESGNVRPIALAPGAYSVWIEHRRMQRRTCRRVDVLRQPTEVEIDIADTHLAGRVIDPRSSSTAGLEVRLFTFSRMTGSQGQRVGELLVVPEEPAEPLALTRTDEEGNYRFDAVPPDFIVALEVRSQGWIARSAGIRCQPRDFDRKWNLQLAPLGSIELDLDTPAPPLDLRLGVQLLQKNASNPQPIGQMLDDDGRASVTGLPLGHYGISPVLVDRFGRIVEFGPPSSASVTSGSASQVRWSW